MAEFNTFDLGRVIQTAEAIKGLRRQEETDRLQQAYFKQRTASDAAQETRAAAAEGREQMRFSQEQQIANTKLINAAAAEVAQDPTAIDRWLPQFKAAGILRPDYDPRSEPPEVLQQKATALFESTSAALAALSGPQETGPLEAFIDPNTRQPVYGTRRQALGQRPYDKPPSILMGSFRPLTPEEVKAAGLPPGTSAQLDENTGKIDVLSKRDTTASLSQKDATTAKMKLNTVKLARQQLNNIRQRFKPLKNSASAGPFGQGKVPTEKGKAFDRTVDQMRSTLTALTRVPGVGAMSDYETRLDQAKFPTRGEYESVTAQQIDDLDNMLNAIEQGYTDLLSGGAQATPDGEAAMGEWQIEEVQ